MTKKQKILSISVAAYNLGSMIEDNLKSFCRKEYIDDIEVLIVDDGSTDDTCERATKYAERYPNSIKIIKQKNAGPGATVNTGIKHATGKYFRMVDGDDWVNPAGFAKLIKTLKTIDADLILSNYSTVNESTGAKEVVPLPDLPTNELLSFENLDFRYATLIRMHHAVFRTSIMKKHVHLNNGFYTDSEYTFFPTPYLKNLYYLNETVYMYRIGMAGQSTSIEKMRTNVNRHGIILDELLNYYEQSAKTLNPHAKQYLATQVENFASDHIGIWLLVGGKAAQQNLPNVFKHIKTTSPDIYNILSQNTRSKTLLRSHFLLTRPLAKAFRRRSEGK